jgi:hypothetical protein
MEAKLIRLTHKIAIQVHLVAESCTICSSRSRRPVRKLFNTPSYVYVCVCLSSYLCLWSSFHGIVFSSVSVKQNVTRRCDNSGGSRLGSSVLFPVDVVSGILIIFTYINYS